MKIPVMKTTDGESNMAAIGFDPEAKNLFIQFNFGGPVYKYIETEGHRPLQEVFDEISVAENKGKYFSANIRNRHDFERLTMPADLKIEPSDERKSQLHRGEAPISVAESDWLEANPRDF